MANPSPAAILPRGETPIRVLIVDDSIVARAVLKRMLDEDGGFRVCGVAAGVSDAFAQLGGGLAVDVILLDLEMPGTDGLTALPELIARSGGARVLIVSSTTAAGAAATVRALTLGAADTLLKPSAAAFNGQFAADLLDRLQRIARAPASRRTAWIAPAPRRREAMRCLAIGASTGGPHALAEFFRAMPVRIGVPILVTQHLPDSFIPIFAGQLTSIAGRRCTVASEGAPLIADEILLAPGDAHLGLAVTPHGVHVRLDRASAASGCMPSVDPMLRAAAQAFGAGLTAVVLTGMGRDGAIGAAALARCGGEVLAQDAASSVVWGMPGAVAEAVPDAVLAAPAVLARHVVNAAGAR